MSQFQKNVPTAPINNIGHFVSFTLPKIQNASNPIIFITPNMTPNITEPSHPNDNITKI